MIISTPKDIEELEKAGDILSRVLAETARLVRADITTAQLDIFAERMICDEGAVPAFLNYKPAGAPYPFPAVLCVSINDEVVHGIPSEERVLREGDVVSLDLGLSYHGYFVDSAITLYIGPTDAKTQKLFRATREALEQAIFAAQVGGHLGDIGAAVEAIAKKYDFSVVKELGGHAVGRSVHEKPFVANTGTKGRGEKITEGLVLALEPIFTEGKGDIALLEDEWTYVTKDSSRAAHFEQTILVTQGGPKILTPFL